MGAGVGDFSGVRTVPHMFDTDVKARKKGKGKRKGIFQWCTLHSAVQCNLRLEIM